jgi:hypothetical protein
MDFKKRSCSRNYYDNYVPPYERLLSRNRKWTPKKVKKEETLRNLCKQGILTPFKQPENYSRYFIHSRTDIFIMDKLIDEAKLTYHYSMDTEGDALTHGPATIQVEFIREHESPIIIIIEANYLPPTNSPLFKKIQYLSSIIFTSNNTIYSWGPPQEELEKFIQFNLFNKPIQIIEIDVQNKVNPTEKCGLQDMVKSTFNQHLDKTATLAEWSCGIDLLLGTYIPEHVVGAERTYRMKEEEKYRLILKEYAVNDVFAVTKLSYDMNLINSLTPPPTIEPEEINYEPSLHIQQELSIELKPPSGQLNVHAGDEQPTLNENEINYYEYPNYEEQGEQISIEIELTPSDTNVGIFDFENVSDDDQNEIDDNELRKVHAGDEPMELQLYDSQPLPNKKKMSLYDDDELELISDDELPETMKIHRPFKQLYQREQHQLNESRSVRARDEPRQVRNSYYLGPQLYLKGNPTPNQIINRRHRANRYRHEVIRHVYQEFKIGNIKEILRIMNIRYLNINMRYQELYIGLKNQEQVDHVEQALNRHLFTESHYHHYMKKKKKT